MATIRRIERQHRASWIVDWTDANGKRCRKIFPTKMEAERFHASLTGPPRA